MLKDVESAGCYPLTDGYPIPPNSSLDCKSYAMLRNCDVSLISLAPESGLPCLHIRIQVPVWSRATGTGITIDLHARCLCAQEDEYNEAGRSAFEEHKRQGLSEEAQLLFPDEVRPGSLPDYCDAREER